MSKAPAGKTIAQMRAENPNFDRDLEVSFHLHAAGVEHQKTANIASLVEQRQKIKAAHEADLAKFSAHWKPALEELQKIDNQITAAMHEQGLKSVKTDVGTAILSEIPQAKIKPDERDAYIDFCLENWNEIGGEMLVIGAPKADAVRAYMDAHEGMPPPHVEISNTFRFSIRKA